MSENRSLNDKMKTLINQFDNPYDTSRSYLDHEPGTRVAVDHKTFSELLNDKNKLASRVRELEQGKSKAAEDRYWSLFLAIVYSTPLLAEEAAQRAADYYREGTRVMREITE